MPSRLGGVCPAPTLPASCPSVNVLIDPHAATKDALSGVYVEPLQAPDYGTRPYNYFPQYELPDPSSWDRSPLPAGACVFRVHGMGANCVRNGLLFVGQCPAPGIVLPAPGGFYDTSYCEQGISPGCPIADPWGEQGHWWYLQPDGANVDLVICAPECANSIGSDGRACLSLFPRP